jgi:hypothetical protein
MSVRLDAVHVKQGFEVFKSHALFPTALLNAPLDSLLRRTTETFLFRARAKNRSVTGSLSTDRFPIASPVIFANDDLFESRLTAH